MMVDEVLEEEQNRVGVILDSLIIEMNNKTHGPHKRPPPAYSFCEFFPTSRILLGLPFY